MDVAAWIERIQSDRHYRRQIAAIRTRDARPAAYAAPAAEIPEALHAILRGAGIEQLYAHQAESYDAVAAGENVAIATGTASGKSLCFHLPVLARLLTDPESRALYLMPAKALAYDQLGTLERIVAAGEQSHAVRPACYDGDTPTHKRTGIRRNANLILSNPDMLHVGILPYHAKWAGFLARLRYVVLDEIHVYRGIFGSHVAGVIRRLQRLCRHYGANPQFLCCSATLANPRELAEQLTGLPMRLIDNDGSPRGRRWYVLWNPPFLDAGEVTRRSGNVEAQHLLQDLMESGASTIAFGKARVVAELLYKYTRDALARRRPELAAQIKPYRGGYLPIERREIEQELFSGRLKAVCTTNALELGIDVGALDAAIVVGFPSTFCSFWQQAGRAGRRQDESIAILVAYDDPIDQFLMRQPDFLFERPVEWAAIDPENPHILAAQLGCAAFELPLTQAELDHWSPPPARPAPGGPASEGPASGRSHPPFDPDPDHPDHARPLAGSPASLASEAASILCDEGQLRETGGALYWSSAEFPSAKTNLRTISEATFAILDTTGGRNVVLGQVDSISAPELVYPEAIYLHQADSYIVRELDYPMRTAKVERFDADYYTQPVLASDCRIVQPRIEADWLGGKRNFGDVLVRWQTIAFRKFKYQSMELIGQTALNLPGQEIHTTGCWLQPPAEAIRQTTAAGHRVWEALSGARNLLVVALPALAMSDRYDIGGVVDSTQLGVSVIILYDRYEGGVGYSRRGFEDADELLRLAHRLAADCPCAEGCPACVAPPNVRVAIHHDPDLYKGYEMPNKSATLALLQAWLA